MFHFGRSSGTSLATVLAITIVLLAGRAATSQAAGQGRARSAAGSVPSYHSGLSDSYTATQNDTTGSGNAETDSVAIAQTLAGLDRSVILSVSLSAPGPGTGYDHGEWLNAMIASPPTAAYEDLLPSIWEASLAQGAIADRIAGATSNLADVIVDSTISAQSPDGSTVPVAGGAGDITSHQVFAAQKLEMTDSAIANMTDSALATFKLTPINIAVLHPLGPAISVRAQVNDLDRLKGEFSDLLESINPNEATYEGVYLELEAGDGRPLVRVSQSLRTGVGQVWFAPGMDDFLGIMHG